MTTEKTAVVSGTVRTGQNTIYYSDQLIELKDTEIVNGNRTVLSQLTDEILVLQQYTKDYSELLSEQEYFVVGSNWEDLSALTESIIKL